MKTRRASVATMVALSWTLSSVAAGQPSHRFRATAAMVTDLGSIGGPVSSALDINDSGQVVGWARTMTGVQHAFLFSNGSMTDIGAGFGPFDNVANGINSSGAVVGTLFGTLGGPVGLLWTGSGPQFLMVAVGRIPPDPTVGLAINDSGDVCGTFFQPGALSPGPIGMVWVNGLAQRGAHEGTPVDINSSGFVVGDMARWTPTGLGLFHTVPVPPPASTGYSGGESLALNDHGYVVGSISLTSGPGSPAERAYLWDGSSPNSVEIGVLLFGNNSRAEDINELTFVAGHADEHVVRGPFDYTHEVAFLYHRDFGLYPLPFLSSTTPLGSCRAVAINEWQPSTSLIQLAGECDTLAGPRAVRWDVTVQSVSILPQFP
jgi:probable HAF family extracellular repeat protein